MSEPEGIALSSTNGMMWDLFKAILAETETAPSDGSHADIKLIAESGLDVLRGEEL